MSNIEVQNEENSCIDEDINSMILKLEDEDEIVNHYPEGVSHLEDTIERLRLLLEERQENEKQNFSRSLSEPLKTEKKQSDFDYVLRSFSLKEEKQFEEENSQVGLLKVYKNTFREYYSMTKCSAEVSTCGSMLVLVTTNHITVILLKSLAHKFDLN